MKWLTKLLKRGPKPEQILASVMPELIQLRDQLRRLAQSSDSLDTIVRFFDIVSRWHDRGLQDVVDAFEKRNKGGRHDAIIEKLGTLSAHFHMAGRDLFGWNRTRLGQTVTQADVFLGNIWGLFTKPAYFWMQQKDAPKGGWGFEGMDHLNPYDVVSDQARQFMASHIAPMVKIIGELDYFVVTTARKR